MKKTTFSLIFTVLAAGVLHASEGAEWGIGAPRATELGGVQGTPPENKDWPGWRGADGNGVSTDASFPVSWDATNIRWKTPIPGRGHSSPIVWNDRIFLTSSIEGEQIPERAKKPEHMLGTEVFIHPDMVSHDRRQTMKVMALDAKSGTVLWDQTAYDGPVKDGRHKKSSFASATPVTDGRMVYVFFGTEGLYAYSVDGALKWKQDLGEIRTLGLGYAASPVLYDNVVIVQCDEDNGDKSFIAAFDKTTGKQVWRQPRKVQSSWASPVIVETNGRSEVIAAGTEFVIAYDPKTGRELWRTKGVESNAVPSPVHGHGMVYVTAGYPAKAVLAINPGVAEPAWTLARGTAYVTSPILVGGNLYLSTDRGLLTNVDAKTGAVVYEGGRIPVPATFIASMVAFGDKILQSSEDGDVFVIQAGPEHKVVATNKLGEPIYASPALANGIIYIRGETHLYAIGR
jgi:outer membrane protein assembly factor BamB